MFAKLSPAPYPTKVLSPKVEFDKYPKETAPALVELVFPKTVPLTVGVAMGRFEGLQEVPVATFKFPVLLSKTMLPGVASEKEERFGTTGTTNFLETTSSFRVSKFVVITNQENIFLSFQSEFGRQRIVDPKTSRLCAFYFKYLK